MSLEPRQLDSLAELLRHTAREELDCGAVLDLVAPYLEVHQTGGSLSVQLAAVEQHLRVCPDCHEEFLALKAGLAEPD